MKPMGVNRINIKKIDGSEIGEEGSLISQPVSIKYVKYGVRFVDRQSNV
jgi:hypothetical protein